MTTNQEMSALWAEFFTSPFPEVAAPFWERYDSNIICLGFIALRDKSKNFQFASMGDAARFATACMKSRAAEVALNKTPAPTPLVRIPTQQQIENFQTRILAAIREKGPLTKSGVQKFSNAANCDGGYEAWNQAWKNLFIADEIEVYGVSERGKERFGLPAHVWNRAAQQWESKAVTNVA